MKIITEVGEEEKLNRTASFLQKHLFLITLVAVTLVSLAIRWSCVAFESDDLRKYLFPWFNELRAGGGLPALGKSIGNYNLAYLTLLALGTYLPLPAITVIKGISVLFDYAAAGTAAYLLFVLIKPSPHARLLCCALYALVLLSPETVLNSAVWGQCDSIYTTFCLLSLAFLVQRKTRASIAFWGVALAFKLQAIFFLPLFIIIWLTDKTCKLRYFLLAPGAMLASGLPAIAMGHPPQDIFGIYAVQVGWMRAMTAGCPNFYTFSPDIEFEYFAPAAIFLTLALLGLGAALALREGRRMTVQEILLLAIWGSMVCVYFLPDMHERYLFPTDLLLMALALSTGERNDRLCAFTSVGVSVFSYLPYLFNTQTVSFWVLSLLRLCCLVSISVRLFSNWILFDRQNDAAPR